MANVRSITKQLTCGRCGEVYADVFYRPWTGKLVITGLTDRLPMSPLRGYLELGQPGQQATGAPAADDADARARADFLRCNAGERIYDLPCRQHHSNLATAPQITRALRRTAGSWVTLAAA